MLVRELPNARLVRGQLDPRAAPLARAPDRRDRRASSTSCFAPTPAEGGRSPHPRRPAARPHRARRRPAKRALRPGHYIFAAVASRKEQKEALRREREERERQAAEAASSASAWSATASAARSPWPRSIVLVVLLVAGGGDGSDDAAAERAARRRRGARPADRPTSSDAAEAAGCELESERATAATTPGPGRARCPIAPTRPSSGKHYEIPAEDGAYDDRADVTRSSCTRSSTAA